MLEKRIIDLIYIGTSQDDKGSPHKLQITEQSVKCDLLDNFSSFYYQENQRLMRNSKNFAIAKFYAKDKVLGCVSYELTYVVLDGRKYLVKNILRHKKSSLLVILDCQEVGK